MGTATEQELIYSILNTVRDAEYNNDENVTESLLRSHLATHRADSIRKYYKNGHVVDDEVFQKIQLQLKRVNKTFEYKTTIPKIIRLENHFGFYVQKNGITIPLVVSQEYELQKQNIFGKYLPRIKTEGNTLILYCGKLDSPYVEKYSEIDTLISFLIDEGVNEEQIIEVDFFGVLHNPSDQPGYDWEKDIYPFPSERIPELRQQVMVREFGIMKESKSDEIQNARVDNVRYHEEPNVEK